MLMTSNCELTLCASLIAALAKIWNVSIFCSDTIFILGLVASTWDGIIKKMGKSLLVLCCDMPLVLGFVACDLHHHFPCFSSLPFQFQLQLMPRSLQVVVCIIFLFRQSNLRSGVG